MSSKALEAIRRRHAAPTSGPWDTSRGTLSDYVAQSRLDVLALLAELARLEQERDAFRRNSVLNLGAMSRWRERAEAAEAALAAARAREQRLEQERDEFRIEADCGLRDYDALELQAGNMRRALEQIAAGRRNRTFDPWAREVARAALADQPAAATLAEPEQPGECKPAATVAEECTLDARCGDIAPGSASAAADEPCGCTHTTVWLHNGPYSGGGSCCAETVRDCCCGRNVRLRAAADEPGERE